MSKFKWCFIGVGRLAHKVAAQLMASGRHEIVSCYARNYEKAATFSKEYGGRAYVTAEEAMLADGVEGVYVVTPHNAHFRYVKQAIELGKPVLCEKAFTVEAKDTDELLALAREKGIYLCEGMWTWFGPAANRVKGWIDEGRIGDVKRLNFTYYMRAAAFSPRVGDPKRAGGALLDITIYPVTYAYRLLGKPLDIKATGTVKGGIDRDEKIEMTFDKGVSVTVDASLDGNEGEAKMAIIGEKGRILADDYHFSSVVCLEEEGEAPFVFSAPNGTNPSYLYEFDGVAEEIRAGLTESPMVPHKATSDVMHILDEIRRQIGLVYTDLE